MIDFAKKSERYALRQLALVKSAICQPGKIMFWSGHKLVETVDLSKPFFIPRGADTAFLAEIDYQQVMGN